ncbi:13301_t:CDS:2 [Funneliformis caledonium]|uniref:13301_t:CDS:1 n=1 Tax=Funneliformis caledonium TaxID=1117310 RepID=A0A9N9B722_9GLOM|nr:13301_t:CDS:2 [Funneliformis caledonium]
MKWHNHFLKMLDVIVSNCNRFLDNFMQITTDDDDLRSYALAAMNKVISLGLWWEVWASRHLFCCRFERTIGQLMLSGRLEHVVEVVTKQARREKLIIAQDSLSQTAAQNEKTRKRFWEIDALEDDDTKHDDIISNIEGFLMSAFTSPSPSFSTSVLADQNTEHGQAEEIKQYLNDISKNVVKKLRNTVKTNLLRDGNTK